MNSENNTTASGKYGNFPYGKDQQKLMQDTIVMNRVGKGKMKNMKKNSETPSILEKNNFKERLSYAENYNLAIFKIFSDYFNIIFQDIKKQKKDEIEIIGLLGEGFVDTINLYYGLGDKEVWFKFLEMNIKMKFNIYKSYGEIVYQISLISAEKTEYKSNFVYEEIFQRALKESELIGSYLTMPAGKFIWQIKDLEKRTIDDIYLPIKQMEDLQMLIDVYSNNEELLRYLMVGVPGTGKTEACLVLMNLLKEKKVTIIKTPVCKFLNEKIKLAILLKPCLIIFDDIDLSLGSRNSGGWSEMLQSFLDILDGTEKLPKDVGILATTNSAFLLDLAAQRPGRFNKVMIFDELSKENIHKIILKSLKYNFNLVDETISNIFTNKKIIEKFHSNQVTGAQIYISTSMMKLKYDMFTEAKKETIKLTVEWLLNEIDEEIKTLGKIRSQQKITDKLNNGRSPKSIGFGNSNENEFFEDAPCEVKVCSSDGEEFSENDFHT